MNTLLNHKPPFVSIVSLALIFAGALLTGSALIAQSPTPTASPQKGKCQAWFENLSKEQTDDVAEAFNQALQRSTTEQTLRDYLLSAEECYKSPKEKMQEIVNDVIKHHPGHRPVQFPPDWRVIFYVGEPESATPIPSPNVKGKKHAGSEHKSATYRPSKWTPMGIPVGDEHCLTIVELPALGQPIDNSVIIGNYQRCCYQPW
jgi:hypothetical protein